MPLVQVSLLEGRSTEQKRRLAKRITDAMAEEAGARAEAVVVTFIDLPKDSYSSGGVLMCDKAPKPSS